MAASNGLGKTLGVIALVAVGVVIGFVVGWGWTAFLAPFLASVLGTKQPAKAPDLVVVRERTKAEILAQPATAIVASLDPDTRAGIAAVVESAAGGVSESVVDDALAEARRLSEAHADGGGVQGGGPEGSGQGGVGSSSQSGS